MERHSVLQDASGNSLHKALVDQQALGYSIETWDPDTECWQPITNYIVDPESKTIRLYTDDD